MTETKLTKDQESQIQRLNDYINNIKKNGAFDLMYICGLSDAEGASTERMVSMMSLENGCHAANYMTMSSVLAQTGRYLQDEMLGSFEDNFN